MTCQCVMLVTKFHVTVKITRLLCVMLVGFKPQSRQ
jgi:hypothetical protein